MEDIIEHVQAYRKKAIHAAKAHLVSAEFHRSRDQKLGITAIVLSALVSTAVFVSLSKQLTLDDINGHLWSWAQILATGIISVIIVAAPILTAATKYMHDAEDAASHGVSATRYDKLVRQYDLFLLEFADADESKRDLAIKAMRELDVQYATARENNISLTDKAKRDAKRLLSECTQTTPSPSAPT